MKICHQCDIICNRNNLIFLLQTSQGNFQKCIDLRWCSSLRASHANWCSRSGLRFLRLQHFQVFWSPLWNALWQELFDEYFETIQTKSECWHITRPNPVPEMGNRNFEFWGLGRHSCRHGLFRIFVWSFLWGYVNSFKYVKTQKVGCN